MNTHDRNVDVIQQLVEKLDGHAAAEEDHDLLPAVLLQEGEQEQEPLLRGTNHKALHASTEKPSNMCVVCVRVCMCVRACVCMCVVCA